MSVARARGFIAVFCIFMLSACGGEGKVEFDEGTATGGNGPSTSSLSNSSAPDSTKPGVARQLYVEQCASCHGDMGQGGAAGKELYSCSTCADHIQLNKRILETMPPGKPQQCDADCSLKLTYYILSGFVDESGGAGSSAAASSIRSSLTSGNISSAQSSASSLPGASSSSLAGNASSASSIVVIAGDPVAGKEQYGMCVGCHGVKGPGSASLGGVTIDMAGLKYVAGDLVIYIRDEMPPFTPSECAGDCARNVAAYLQTWVMSGSGSSLASSSFISSSRSSIISSSSSRSSTSSRSSISSSNSSTSSLIRASSSSSSSLPTSSSSVSTISSSSAVVSSSSSVMSSSSSAKSSSSSSSVAALSGKTLYDTHCAGCHGTDGMGNQPIVLANWTIGPLATRIQTTMPPQNPSLCVGECASAIAEYLMSLKPVVACSGAEAALPRRLRLLSNYEYANTLRDLLGIANARAIAEALPASNTARGYDNNALATSVTTSHISSYWNASGTVAESANIASLLSCAAVQRSTCADSFLQSFGARAFRRPLTAAEMTGYRELFLAGADNTEGARHVIRAMLTSANFLYRSELGALANGSYRLTPYETASYLSYTFWGSMPDAELLAAAASDSLKSPAQLRTQVTRLLADARAKSQLTHFARQWLKTGSVVNLPRDSSQWSTGLAQAMDTELDLFIQELFFKAEYSFEDLFTADFVFANSQLANFYGISGADASFRKLPANSQRGGLLTMGAVLATNAKPDQSDPIHRGLLVRNRLLCQEFGAPPPNVGEVGPLDPDKSTRDRFAAHTSNENCQFCHQHIDPIGFSFENYDAIGQFRLMESNVMVDNSGTISGLVRMTDPDAYDYHGPKELGGILAGQGRESAASCFVDQFHTYMQGVTAPDQCVTRNVMSRWSGNQFSIRDLWLQAVSSDSFLVRQ